MKGGFIIQEYFIVFVDTTTTRTRTHIHTCAHTHAHHTLTHVHTNRVTRARSSLARMALHGNGPDQGDIQPVLNVCQDERFGKGHADGKVGCQPREGETPYLSCRKSQHL